MLALILCALRSSRHLARDILGADMRSNALERVKSEQTQSPTRLRRLHSNVAVGHCRTNSAS